MVEKSSTISIFKSLSMQLNLLDCTDVSINPSNIILISAGYL
jgi:hypothetical protein